MVNNEKKNYLLKIMNGEKYQNPDFPHHNIHNVQDIFQNYQTYEEPRQENT